MALDTFEERAAYIEQCELRIRESIAESNRLEAQCNATMLQFSLIWQMYCVNTAALIYRGMFDPDFCAPSKAATTAGEGP